MKKWLIAGAGAAGLLISSVALARVDVGISIGVPGVVYPAPVYAPPAPVYVAPAPVYAPPPPVYYRPAPVYVAPPVVYPAPVYIRGGYWGATEAIGVVLTGAITTAAAAGIVDPATARKTKATPRSGLFPGGNFRCPAGIVSGRGDLDNLARHDGGRLLRRRIGLGNGPTRRFLDEIDPATRRARRPPPTIMRTHEQTPVHR